MRRASHDLSKGWNRRVAGDREVEEIACWIVDAVIDAALREAG
jgi:hypothetical protein